MFTTTYREPKPTPWVIVPDGEGFKLVHLERAWTIRVDRNSRGWHVRRVGPGDEVWIVTEEGPDEREARAVLEGIAAALCAYDARDEDD